MKSIILSIAALLTGLASAAQQHPDSAKSAKTDSTAKKEKTLAAVTVTSKKPYAEYKADRTIINVDAAITSSGTTVLETLEKMPGVAVDKDGNISLKGKQGVIVLIDGKQTYMSAPDLAQYLSGMPATNIEQVELMPNPSSKYDAAGRSGVINIKTKKNRQIGFNGNLSTSYGRSTYGRSFNSLNLNYRNGKFSFFANGGVNLRRNNQELIIHREYSDDAGNRTAIFDQTSLFVKDRGYENFKIGADFFASKKTTIGAVITGYTTSVVQDNINTSFLKDGTGIINSILDTKSTDDENWKNLGVNLNMRHSFDSTGREITADVDVLRYRSKRDQSFVSDNFTPNWVKQSTEELISALPAEFDVYSAKTDYTQSIGKKTKLEAGLKSSFVTTDNRAGYFNVLGAVTVPDNDKTNSFRYRENINAAYTNLNRDFKKWSLQAGLRLENTNYAGTQYGNPLRSDSSFSRTYTNLFPTFFAGYELNKKNNFSFSYGRRISRPDYESLNPFIFFIDKYTYEAGNPYLRPMYSNVLELNHTYNKVLNTSLSYNHSKDLFNESFEEAGFATIVREANYGSTDDLNFSVSAQLKPAKWWSFMPYGEMNYLVVNSRLNGRDINTKATSFNFNVNNKFTLANGWSGEVSGFLRSPITKAQFRIGSMKQMNAGISKQVWKQKGSFRLSMNDVFYSNKQRGTIDIGRTVAMFRQRNDSRHLTLTFAYKFGKPMKIQQRKTGGAGDVESRIKAG